MFSRIKGFLGRHKKKFIFTGILIGGTTLAIRYAKWKLREWQEGETKEFLERTQRQQHFESTERTCNQTIVSLAPSVHEVVVQIFNTDDIVTQLRTSGANKIILWDQLKVISFTRAAVFVYAGTMLVLTLRIQLNLIGGYMYQDSAEENSTKVTRITSSLQECFLSSCHFFIEHGMKELCKLMEDKVKPIMEGVSLKKKLTLQDTEQLFWAIQASVTADSRDPIKSLPRYMMPAIQDNTTYNLSTSETEVLHKMVAETIDLLESDEVTSLAASSVSRAFTAFIDQISDFFTPAQGNKAALNAPQILSSDLGPVAGSSKSTDSVALIENQSKNGYSNGTPTFVHPNNVTMPLAKLLPVVNSIFQNNGRADGITPWINQHILNDKLKLLGANVYEAFCQKV
uniref:Peroxisomal biogenesis factor 3 n=1 Tax=Timema monikensis TaxID=170555 RepID=A0A7R9E8R7_9NEOP|nr:unnamed protein product [Timema monikensis]